MSATLTVNSINNAQMVSPSPQGERPINSLPTELLQRCIFSPLHRADNLRARLVCRTWNANVVEAWKHSNLRDLRESIELLIKNLDRNNCLSWLYGMWWSKLRRKLLKYLHRLL